MENTNERPKPDSFGFDIDFNDLSKVKPKTVNPAIKSTQQIKPKTASKAKAAKTRHSKPNVLKAREAASDKIAKSMGFASREAQPILLKKRRRTHHDEPVDQLSIRGPVRVLNDFISLCETQGVSYWEGLETLLDMSKIPNSKK